MITAILFTFWMGQYIILIVMLLLMLLLYCFLGYCWLRVGRSNLLRRGMVLNFDSSKLNCMLCIRLNWVRRSLSLRGVRFLPIMRTSRFLHPVHIRVELSEIVNVVLFSCPLRTFPSHIYNYIRRNLITRWILEWNTYIVGMVLLHFSNFFALIIFLGLSLN
jgi:hypothetical protein